MKTISEALESVKNVPSFETGIVIVQTNEFLADWQYADYVAGYSDKDLAWLKKNSRPARISWNWDAYYSHITWDATIVKANYRMEIL